MLIPTAHPIAQLRARPVPGWTIRLRTTLLAADVMVALRVAKRSA